MFRVLGVVASKFPETFSPLSGAKRKNIMKNIRFYSTIVTAVAVGILILICSADPTNTVAIAKEL